MNLATWTGFGSVPYWNAYVAATQMHLFTEPGHNLHAPADIGVDSFQSDRSPTRAYRKRPRSRGSGHTRRVASTTMAGFATLRDVLQHYDQFFKLGLTEPEKIELGEYLKSL